MCLFIDLVAMSIIWFASQPTSLVNKEFIWHTVSFVYEEHHDSFNLDNGAAVSLEGLVTWRFHWFCHPLTQYIWSLYNKLFSKTWFSLFDVFLLSTKPGAEHHSSPPEVRGFAACARLQRLHDGTLQEAPGFQYSKSQTDVQYCSRPCLIEDSMLWILVWCSLFCCLPVLIVCLLSDVGWWTNIFWYSGI